MGETTNLKNVLLISVFLVVLAVSGNACAKIIYVDADVNAYNRFFTHSATKLSEIFLILTPVSVQLYLYRFPTTLQLKGGADMQLPILFLQVLQRYAHPIVML